MKSVNPLHYYCAHCTAPKHKMCRTPKGELRAEFHSTRKIAMLDAHRPEPMLLSLCEAHRLVLRVDQPYIFRPLGICTDCAKMAEQAREAYGPTMGAA